MAEPSCASQASYQLERELKEIMVKTCEVEQRSKLFVTLVRLGLVTREVESALVKEGGSQRMMGKGNKSLSGASRMKGKLGDSRGEEDLFRRRRDVIRNDLEDAINNNGRYGRVMKKLKAKVQRIKKNIQVKNKEKVNGYKRDKIKKEIAELASLKDEMGEFGKLRIFEGVTIPPEERKPPVTSEEVSLSEDELLVLSKNPKFAVRSMMSKERFMAEYEKGLCKKKYSDIGKEEINGKTVEETPIDEEDARIMKEAEWQGVKSELVYDFESKSMDFGNQKATNMKRNKRIKLPKASSIQMEAFLEVRRKEGARLYDMCLKELGEGAEKGMDNLSGAEKKGLRSLKKRVAAGELIICQTDKSGRFCVLTRQQYLEAGWTHTEKDRRITLED